jgi:hypothetical protein
MPQLAGIIPVERDREPPFERLLVDDTVAEKPFD